MKKMGDIPFYQQCYLLRKRAGLSQKQVAKKYNVKIYLYQLFETDGLTLPTLVDKLSEFYNNYIGNKYYITAAEELSLWTKYENDSVADAAARFRISASTLSGICQGRKTSKETADKIYRKTGIIL